MYRRPNVPATSKRAPPTRNHGRNDETPVKARPEPEPLDDESPDVSAPPDVPESVETGVEPVYVNWSADPVGEACPATVTIMSTVVAVVAAGLVAEQLVVEVHDAAVPAMTPNAIVLALVENPVPVTVTTVPPAIGPELGLMAVTVGPEVYVNWSAALVGEVLALTAAIRSTEPALPTGLVAVQLVADVHVTAVPATVPKSIMVEPEVVENPDPVMVTTVPPASGPALGLMLAIVGPEVYVNWSAVLVAEVVPPEVTVTSTAPAVPAGLVAVQLVVELQVTAVPAVAPKATVVPVMANPVPVMVTTVVPASGPALGLMLATVGPEV
jgi:hypothetical protein